MKPPNNSKNSTNANGAKCSHWQGTNQQDVNQLKREQTELK